MAEVLALADEDREQWAVAAGGAVVLAVASVRARVAKALARSIPARARSVFRASWWDWAVNAHVIDPFSEVAAGAVTAAGATGDVALAAGADATQTALDMLAGRADTIRARVRDLHAQAVRERWSAARLRDALGLDGGPGVLSDASADAIGRSLSTVLVERGTHQAAAHLGAATKTWHCAFLPESRDAHRKAHGQTVPLDEPFTIAGHDAMHPGDPALPVDQTVNCVPADARVSGFCTAAMRSWYRGDLVDVITASGKKLSATPDHHVLTGRGWVRIGRLQPGDELFGSGEPDAVAGPGDDPRYGQPTAEQAFRAAQLAAPARQRAGATVMHLDSDVPDREVDVERPDLPFAFGRYAEQMEHLGEVSVPVPHGQVRLADHPSAEFRVRHPDQGRLVPGADREPEIVEARLDDVAANPELFGHGLDRDVVVVQGSDLGEVAGASVLGGSQRLATGVQQAGRDDGLGDAEVARDVGHAAAPVVPLDHSVDVRGALLGVTRDLAPFRWDPVVSVSTRIYVGHVYDFTTPAGLFCSDDFVVHNCRCWLTYETADDEPETLTAAPALTGHTPTEVTPMDLSTLAATFAVPSGRVVVTVEPTAAEKQALGVYADVPAELHVPLLDVGDVASLTPDARTALAGALSTVAASTPPLSGTVAGVGWLEAQGVTVGLVDCPGLGDLRDALADALVDMAPEPGEFIPSLVLTAGSVDATQIAGTPLHFNELRVRAGAETLVFDLLGPIPGAPDVAAPEPEEAPEAPPEPPPAESPTPVTAVTPYGRVIPVPEPASPEELSVMTTTTTNTYAAGGNFNIPAGWRLVPATTAAGMVTFQEMPGMAPEGEVPPDLPPPAALADVPDEELEAEIARRAAEQAAAATGAAPEELLPEALEEVAGIVAEIVAELESEPDEEEPAPAPPAAVGVDDPGTFAGELAPDANDDGVGETPTVTDYDWEGILAIEGVPTSDGRMFAEGALTWRTLPLTLALQTVTAPGHDGAVVCGSICEIERVGNTIVGRGRFSSTEAGELARTLIGEGSLHGVSIDVASAIVVYTDENGDEMDPMDAVWEGAAVAVFVEAEMMAATLTPFPAFADARVDLLDQPTSLVATGAPGCWRLTGPAFFTLLDGQPATDALVASAASTVPAPPAHLFALRPDTREPFSVGAPLPDGTIPVYGLLADWNIPHIGFDGRKVYPPRGDDFAMFYTGKHVRTREGDRIPTGPIFIDTVHPNLALQASDAQAFYAHTGAAVADVHLYNAEHGIVAAGVLRPDVDELTRRRMEGSDVSPDWRPINGQHRMVAILAVNASGFPVPYVEGIAASAGRLRSFVAYDPAGEPLAMVAVGAVRRERRPVDVLAAVQAQTEDNARRLTALESAFFVAAGANQDPGPDDPDPEDPDPAPAAVAADDGPVELSADERAARALAAMTSLGLDRESRARRARASLGLLEPVG